MRLHGKTGLAPLLALSIVLVAGCAWLGVQRPEVSSLEDAIAVSSADITAIATKVHALCGNEVPGGPCLDGAVIDTVTKESLRMQLQEAQDALVLANAAVNINNVEAGDNLRRAESLLELIREELERRQQ